MWWNSHNICMSTFPILLSFKWHIRLWYFWVEEMHQIFISSLSVVAQWNVISGFVLVYFVVYLQIHFAITSTMLNYNFAPARYLDMDCSKFSEFLLQDDHSIRKVIIFILPDEGNHNNNQNIAIKILKNFEQCMSEYRAGVITNLCYHDLQVILNYNYLYHANVTSDTHLQGVTRCSCLCAILELQSLAKSS